MALMTMRPMERESLELLIARLSWPVPVVRWRAARALRDLLNSQETRLDATHMLLRSIAAARCETECCAGLTVFLMAESHARPALEALRDTLRYPSILASLLFRHMYGEDGPDWQSSHSAFPSVYFEPEPFFIEHRTAHVPPILSTNLRSLERHANRPFMRQWAFEWQTLQDKTGVPRSSYPHYFGRVDDVKGGFVGQYIQGQGELYRSAYLRTLAYAVDHWEMPRHIAEHYAMYVVPAVPGLFEIDPVPRPAWLGDIPERCAASPGDLEQLARQLIDATRELKLRPMSLISPIVADVAEHGEFAITAHLVADDYSGDESDDNKMEIADFESAFNIEGDRPETPLDKYSDQREGSTAPVCTSMLPQPYGYWQSHYFATGLPVAASYVLPMGTRMRCTRGGVELLYTGRLVGTTSYWHDRWSPEYPREGNTRCGVYSTLEATLLPDALKRLGRRVVWKANMRLWQRASTLDEFEIFEKTVVFGD
ncbi:hypothetical protein [Cereibacter sphaeroides]|uniref:hypothetical protein n=1 Tax=Cereibacter sphaeroides TaxID=1063 RepID=UPI003FCCE2AE